MHVPITCIEGLGAANPPMADYIVQGSVFCPFYVLAGELTKLIWKTNRISSRTSFIKWAVVHRTLHTSSFSPGRSSDGAWMVGTRRVFRTLGFSVNVSTYSCSVSAIAFLFRAIDTMTPSPTSSGLHGRCICRWNYVNASWSFCFSVGCVLINCDKVINGT